MIKTGVCITTRNEHETIYDLVRTLGMMGFEVFVADDVSTDGTALMAEKAGAHVTRETRRQGIGPCMRFAWLLALAHGCERIVQMDAGGSHDPADIHRLLTTQADVVIGSRFCKGARYTGRPWRAVLSRLAALACNFAQPHSGWSDWTSGYRVFTAKAARMLIRSYSAKMHGWQMEVLAVAGELGLNIAEAPISYKAGRSAFNRKIAMEAFETWLHILHHVSARKVTV